MPVLQFPRGLHTGIGGADPEHVYEAKNVYEFCENLVGRGGTDSLGAVDGWFAYDQFDVPNEVDGYFAADDVDVATVIPSTQTLSTAGKRYLYVGNPLLFNRCFASGFSATLVTDTAVFDDFPRVDYWNGSAWTELKVARAWRPNQNANGGTLIRPFFSGDFDAGQMYASGMLWSCSFVPPSDWTARTLNISIGGTAALYMLRVSLASDHTNVTAPGSIIASVTVDISSLGFGLDGDGALSANRTLAVFPYATRLGAGHVFVAARTNGKLQCWIDGKIIVFESGFTQGRPVNANTDVWCTYHAGTDTVFVRVAGDRWFELPGSPGDAPVLKELVAGGVGTIYESLDRGLRTIIPTGAVNAQFEGRLWEASDSWVRWSASDVYPDVWPNEFEQYVYDRVTCMVPTKTWMAIFTHTGCYRAINDGTADGYMVEKMLGGVGCVGPRAACAVGDYVFFLSTDGVYRMTGDGAITKVSSTINEWWTTSRSGALAKAVMLYHGHYDQLRLFYPSNAESDVLDEALYCNARGYEYAEDGVKLTGMAWWPQGRKLPTDYGFNATAIAMDNRTTEPVMLVGDKYGLLWRHDVGDCDNGVPVYRHVLSAPINFDTSRNVIIRWVNVTMENTGNVQLAMLVRPDVNQQLERSVNVKAYVNSAGNPRLGDDSTLADDTTTVKGEDQALIREVSFSQRCRTLMVGFTQEQYLPLALTGVEVRANAMGEIGGR